MRKFILTIQAALVLINAIGQQITVESPQESLGPGINSKFFEQNPLISIDGTNIYFVRSGDPQNTGGVSDKGDIWISTKVTDGTWSAAQRINAPINTIARNAIIGFQDDLMLLNYNYGKSVGGGFSVSRKIVNIWEEPVDVSIPFFKSQSEFESAAISPNGEAMIFSIQSFGTYGVEDLFYTTMQSNGKWSDLRNIGPTINTPYQELTPFISPDGQYLYFASNGHQGYGGMDIFASKRLDDGWRNWTEPVNLGELVNTVGSETSFSFLPEADWAILVSTQNSDGYGDLKKVAISFPEDYSVPDDTVATNPISVIYDPMDVEPPYDQPLKPALNTLKGRLINIKNRQPIDGNLIIIGETDTVNIKSSINSGFVANVVRGDFRISATAIDFLDYDTLFTFSRGGEVMIDLYLEPLDVGNTISLKHVLFERGTTDLVPGSERDLQTVYNMLSNNPSIEILVEGHTDNQGVFRLNVELSQQRVDAVIKYLVDRGIKINRLKGKGWGAMKPIANNSTEESRKMNRRVEFTITGK
ncbi:MAG: OmpA family protein [Bacteroidetes bacterium]|nr:OmpA family protein [Bacteroidota bacterium]